MAVWVIARLTFKELLRRRLVLALLALTAIVVGLTAWGFSRIPGLHIGGQPLTPGEVQLASSQLLLLVMFMFSFVLALTCAFLAAPAVAGDLESGIAQAVLARPLRREEFLVGRWVGLAVPVLVYAVLSTSAVFLLVDWTTGYLPRQLVPAEAALVVEGLCLLTLALALSTRLSTMTAGVISVIAFGTMWLGGVAGAFGQVFHNQAISDVGVITHFLLPTDGMWRAAVFAIEPVSSVAAASHGFGSTFQVSQGPTMAYLAYVGCWFVAVLVIALFSLHQREI
ncbi:MAG: ABC transporter permease subunit [Candidatus Dormibacteraeota bacterium]|jgi:ABC-type transport system involved in multi-copper enzyme maturation permease subunit|nr:ABC transporter permease subunit [Candidatus Dormibacteraeota bacterium]